MLSEPVKVCPVDKKAMPVQQAVEEFMSHRVEMVEEILCILN